MDSFGEKPKVVFTNKPGHGTSLARNLLKKRFKNIVAIGGDGTINEVANGFFEEKEQEGSQVRDSQIVAGALYQKLKGFKPINRYAVLSILPCGTRNVLSKSLDMPGDLLACCQNFQKCRPKKIDVISTTVTDPIDFSRTQSRIFLNAAEIGVAAEIINRSKKIRDKVKSRIVSTVSSVMTTLPTYESNLCEISIDHGQESILTKMTMAVIANGKYLGGGFKAASQASMSDGLLDIVILKNSGSFKMLEEFISMKNGNYDGKGDIFYMHARKVSIKSREEKKVTVTIDGEPIGVLPAAFQVIPSALTVRM
jgi:diacylglycerol kinase (ATP)